MNKQVLLVFLLAIISVLVLAITVNAQKEKYKSPPLEVDNASYELYKKETNRLLPIPASLSQMEREQYLNKIISQGPMKKEKAVPSQEFLDVEKEDLDRSFPDSEYLNEYGIPIGDGKVESNIFDGLDNDNDGVIDEGIAINMLQIAVIDAGKSKDDEFELFIDGISFGKNIGGRVRFWNLDLPEGIYEVVLKGLKIPDGIGTYRIWFNKCQMVSGMPTQGILDQGNTVKWKVKSEPTRPPHSYSE